MKKVLCFLFVSVILSGCSMFAGEEEPQLQSRLISISQSVTTYEVASVVEPAIVGISGQSKSGESVGSGVCVAEGGYVLTNSHVISGSEKIVLHLSNKTTSTATVVYDNPVLDFAILKSSKSLPYLKLANSDNMLVGEDVLAVGTPLSLSLTHTFTKGIVSALNRTLKVGGDSGEGLMQNLIQHDASLNPGNSGGPLLNTRGEVVGINTLKISGGEGIGFAIPTKSFESLLSSYVKDLNYDVPYLGLYGLDSEIVSYYDNNASESGFYVIDVANNSPLKDTELMPEAVITRFNGVEITNTLNLKNELYKYTAQDSVFVEFEQGGQIYKTKIKLCEQN